jgi:hypothetical protein
MKWPKYVIVDTVVGDREQKKENVIFCRCESGCRLTHWAVRQCQGYRKRDLGKSFVLSNLLSTRAAETENALIEVVEPVEGISMEKHTPLHLQKERVGRFGPWGIEAFAR